MRKLFLAILIFSSFSSFAQFRFGIVGTPQVTWMKSDVKEIQSEGIKLGIAYGLNLDYAFGENASLTTGIFVNNSGGKLKYALSDTTEIISFEYGSETIDTLPAGVTITYKNQYLEIPIGLKFKTNEIGMLKYYAQIGLTPMIAIGAKAESENTLAADKIDNEKFLKEVSMIAVGYHIGGGVEYNLSGNTSLLAGLVYTNGFTDVTRNPTSKKTTNIKDKSILNGISIKVGILF